MQLAPLRPRRRRPPFAGSGPVRETVTRSQAGDLSAIAERIAGLIDGPVSEALVVMLTELYGDALARIVAVIAAEPGGAVLIDRMCADRLVGGLFVVHDLHPDPLVARVEHAIAACASAVSLERIEDDIVYIRLTGEPAAAECEAVARAIGAAAPEIVRVCVATGVGGHSTVHA